MGNLQASEMAALSAAGQVNLHAAIDWHLRYNHYPPVPESMVPVAVRAVRKAQQGDWDASVRLPKGVTLRRTGKTLIGVAEIIETFHLEEFVGESEGDPE